MDKQDYSWRRLCVVRCVVLVLVVSDCGSGKQMSETLQRALSAVRGPSPGAKKLLNIPEDGGAIDPKVFDPTPKVMLKGTSSFDTRAVLLTFRLETA
ncbi:hypothetical protein RR48_05959 [Papilio machaon]|uniref:Uncharacterized protein n=1 Tax=Papilio machaon TaxID=76193 RepID=A0A0N1PHY7_PAPMA|nr:hypothetical protein RR48_05959 [Papilio machaon]